MSQRGLHLYGCTMEAGGTRTLDRQKVTINVGGRVFVTWERTLRKFPFTLLGSDDKESFYDENKMEYFFDRDPAFFRHILNFYRKGKVHFSNDECGLPYEEELRFYKIPEDYIAPCCREDYETYTLMNQEKREKRLELRGNSEGVLDYGMSACRKKIYAILEFPEKSLIGKVIFYLLAITIVGSLISTITETISCGQKKCGEKYADEFRNAETVCVGIFTVEFMFRLYATPYRCQHLRSFTSIIDILAILPFYINTFISLAGGSNNPQTQALATLRVFRIFRVFKLIRNNERLTMLGKSLKASAPDLLFICAMISLGVIIFSILIYFMEKLGGNSEFSSIPSAMWFSVQTMTTLGYGDVTPKTTMGRMIAAVCCLLGILVISLPVPIIEMKQAIQQKYRVRKDTQENDDQNNQSNTIRNSSQDEEYNHH